MKKTIKVADMMAYLDEEIQQTEAAAERYATQLNAIDNGEYKGVFPPKTVKARLEAHLTQMEHTIGTLGKVKQAVYNMTKEVR